MNDSKVQFFSRHLFLLLNVSEGHLPAILLRLSWTLVPSFCIPPSPSMVLVDVPFLDMAGMKKEYMYPENFSKREWFENLKVLVLFVWNIASDDLCQISWPCWIRCTISKSKNSPWPLAIKKLFEFVQSLIFIATGSIPHELIGLAGSGGLVCIWSVTWMGQTRPGPCQLVC